MQAELFRFQEKLKGLGREGLLALCLSLKEEQLKNEALLSETAAASEAMAREYRALLKQFHELQEKSKEQEKQLRHLAEQNVLKTNVVFGRGTERLKTLLSTDYSSPGDICGTEELEEKEMPPGEEPPVVAFAQQSRQTKHRGRKEKGKRQKVLDALPQISVFYFRPEELDAAYGAGNWKIRFWDRRRTLELKPASYYVKNSYTPILSILSEDRFCRLPQPNVFYPRSFASPSLFADIIYRKFALGLPAYRQEAEYVSLGIPLSRQTMLHWTNNLTPLYLGPVFDHLRKLSLQDPYHQCDETPLLVNKDGRAPGRKSYLWCHATGVFSEAPPIILFCFTLTRGAEHLREHYNGFVGFVSCDAYSAYQSYESDEDSGITVCGCLMHARRRFADACKVAGLRLPTDREIDPWPEDLSPEIRGLQLIAAIYHEEEQLKGFSAGERYQKRQETVRPRIDEYFSWLEQLRSEELMHNEKLKDAVSYSLNQKEYLSRFLQDGHIPIDNGYAERLIRPVATARHAWMFFDTVYGAQAGAILFSLVATAKANQADVYTYLKYLLERMPGHMDDTDRAFLDDMMPWSDAYRIYEKKDLHERIWQEASSGTPPPVKAPVSRHRERIATSALGNVS